jgi:cytochrome c biogenesis protein ResB
VLQYAHEVHNFGEGAQVVLLKPNQEPRPFWLLKNFPQWDQQRGDEFVLTFEGFTEKEYTGLSVTKDPGVWVVWIGCGLMIFGFIVSFFFSHQRVWVRIPKSPGGEIVLAGSANKNRVVFEKTFGELVEEIRKRSSELRVIHFLEKHEPSRRVANHYLHRTHHPRWTREELPGEGRGLAFFRNAVQYIRNHLL